MPLKSSVKAHVARVYMFFGTGSPNLRSILKPEVELFVFLRMRSEKSRKTAKNTLKCSFKAQFPRVKCF